MKNLLSITFLFFTVQAFAQFPLTNNPDTVDGAFLNMQGDWGTYGIAYDQVATPLHSQFDVVVTGGNDTILTPTSDYGFFVDWGTFISVSYTFDVAVNNATIGNTCTIPLTLIGVDFDPLLDGREAIMSGLVDQLNSSSGTNPLLLKHIRSSGVDDSLYIQYRNNGTYTWPQNHFRITITGMVFK